MHKMKTNSKLIILMGPTGVGKSDLAIALAEQMQQPLFYFEPVLAYKELNIGSAKPSPEDRQRVVHEGIDLTTLECPLTLVDMYQLLLPKILEQLKTTGKAIVVTGSGFFLRALLQGVPKLHERGEGFIRKEAIFERLTGHIYPGHAKDVTEMDTTACFQALENIWPKRAEVVHPHDIYRVLRSLEVAENYLEAYPHLKNHTTIEAIGLSSLLPEDVQPLMYGVIRDEPHYTQCLQTRVKCMFEAGWIDEVKALIQKGAQLQGALKSVGYREIFQLLDGSLTLQKNELLQDRILRAHKKLSRKQLRWFTKHETAIWLNHSRFDTNTLAAFIFQNAS